jgi:hypothetical protein
MQGPDREVKQSPLNAFLPWRYHNLDLPYDWCESPGKRRKRKHRKTSSSKSGVSFVEMSRMIASRWSELERVDMETKIFCQNVSEQKLLEYREDLTKYKAALSAQFESSKAQPVVQPVVDRAPSTDNSLDCELNYSPQYIKPTVHYNEGSLNTPVQAPRFVVSPSNSFASGSSCSSIDSFEFEDEIPLKGSRYGEVDIDDDEIIELFTRKEPVIVQKASRSTVSVYEDIDLFLAQVLNASHPSAQLQIHLTLHLCC